MRTIQPNTRSERSLFRLMAAGLVFLLAAALSACGSDSDAGDSDRASLKVGAYPGALISLPAYVGADAGIFEDHGLDVSLVEISDGRNMTSALASGSIDIGLNGIDNNALANQSGQSIMAVAGNTMGPIFTLIAGSKVDTPHIDEGFPASVQDLKGKKLGVMATGGSVEQFLRYILEAAGLNPDKDVTLVNAGLPATGVPALKAGQIDAYMSIEPAASLTGLDGSGKVVLDLRKQPVPDELAALNWPYNQWISTKKTIDSLGGTLGKYQAAMKDVYAFMDDPANADQLREIALKRISDNGDLVDALLKNNAGVFGFELPSDRIDAAFAYLVDSGLVEKPTAYEDYVAEGASS